MGQVVVTVVASDVVVSVGLGVVVVDLGVVVEATVVVAVVGFCDVVVLAVVVVGFNVVVVVGLGDGVGVVDDPPTHDPSMQAAPAYKKNSF